MIAATHTTSNVNMKAAAWTIGVHVVLLLLFFFISYTLPSQPAPAPEMGMEVNLGTDENGSGTDQPMSTDDPAPNQVSVTYKATAANASVAKDMLQTDNADAPAVNAPTNNTTVTPNNTQTTTKTKVNTQQTSTANNQQQQRARYVYNGGTGTGGNGAAQNHPGTNEGNTFGNGDRGVPNGTPGAANYSGSPGNGNGGISHTLTGRAIVAFPPPDADFREGGRVTIRVTVNRLGVITNKQIVSASSGELRAIALHKVDKVRFNKSDNAPEEQFGEITFVFKTRS